MLFFWRPQKHSSRFVKGKDSYRLVLHTFGSDLNRHVHTHIIMSAGGLKLNAKAERFTRLKERKKQSPRAKMKKVSVLTENPEWVSSPRSKFPYEMLRKRYQALLIKYLKEQIQKNMNSDNPDDELKILSGPILSKTFFDDLKKEYKNGFYVHITKERTDLKQAAAYVGRYARRQPISELRIKDYTGDYISYEFKDYKNNGNCWVLCDHGHIPQRSYALYKTKEVLQKM